MAHSLQPPKVPYLDMINRAASHIFWTGMKKIRKNETLTGPFRFIVSYLTPANSRNKVVLVVEIHDNPPEGYKYSCVLTPKLYH